MMIVNIVDVFNQIKETSSRTGKEAILVENGMDNDFRKILEFLYNPYLLTGIKGKKLQKYAHFWDEDVANKFADVFEAIEYITKNNSGRDEDVKLIATFINNYVDEVHDFLQDLFTKDYKCGITASTINKVYGKGTIPEFDLLLAKSFKDHGHKLKGKFFITLKLDGIRCVAIKQNGSVQFFTRQGQPIDGLNDIEQELQHYPDNTVYDGELLLINDNDLASDELFRATQKVVRKDGIKKNVAFHLFDIVPLDEFLNGKSKKKYEERRSDLNQLLSQIAQFYIRTLPVLYMGDDKSVINEYLADAISNEHEGLMINTADGYYVTKRSDALLKVKEMHTVDLRVVGVEEGSGKNERSLGALIVDYKGYEVKVGSGFTDTERLDIWSRRHWDVIGSIIEVQYFEESSNQDGGISLRFPVFVRVRDDKTEPSLH